MKVKKVLFRMRISVHLAVGPNSLRVDLSVVSYSYWPRLSQASHPEGGATGYLGWSGSRAVQVHHFGVWLTSLGSEPTFLQA